VRLSRQTGTFQDEKQVDGGESATSLDRGERKPSLERRKKAPQGEKKIHLTFAAFGGKGAGKQGSDGAGVGVPWAQARKTTQPGTAGEKEKQLRHEKTKNPSPR